MTPLLSPPVAPSGLFTSVPSVRNSATELVVPSGSVGPTYFMFERSTPPSRVFEPSVL